MSDARTFAGSLFDLSNKRVLLTGASSGLGRHFAPTLAHAGAHVILAARGVGKLQDIAEEIAGFGGRCEVQALDVRDRDAIRACIDELERAAPLDVLVNNAGIAVVKAPDALTDDDWDAVYDTNLRGAWVLAQELIKRRLADGRACSIINIASVLGLRGIGHVAPYAAAKAGLINLGRDLSTDLAKSGIRINAIAPGYIGEIQIRDRDEILFKEDLKMVSVNIKTGAIKNFFIPDNMPEDQCRVESSRIYLMKDKSLKIYSY
jgi:NAD(P)-dependent dehydrogenase (short-subunit alcohol dehydrogenase family)